MVIPLSNIKPGESARIVCLGNEPAMAGRLQDLGFGPGAVVSCVLQKAGKHIAAYLVRGAVIALREVDSRFVLVEPCRNEGRPGGYEERPLGYEERPGEYEERPRGYEERPLGYEERPSEVAE